MINSLFNLFKHYLSPWVFMALFCLFSLNSEASTCTAVSTNNWDNNSTWSCGQVPGCGDTIIIPSGLTVTVNSQQDYSGCAPANIIKVHGVLKFQNGNKLRLNCLSYIEILAGGSIVSGTGSGNSNYIEICNTIVWSAADGAIAGPFNLPETLPITLVSFTGNAKGSQVALNWITSSEVNNSYFAVERSADGLQFKQVGIVDGAGNSTNINSYSLVDEFPHQLTYYRLKQVDYDGAYSYSKTMVVKLVQAHFESINMHADYSAQSIQVLLNSDFAGITDYRLSDILGNTMATGQLFATKGINTVSVPASKLAQGIYYFTIRYDGEVITRKIFY
jgi:hypothetical protein